MTKWIGFLFLLLMSTCSMAGDRTGATPTLQGCVAPEGLDKVANTSVLVFGEYHGTQEMPSLFFDAVCALTQHHADKRILIGLELSESLRVALDRDLTKHHEAALSAVRADPFWIAFGDGRRSAQMLGLIERLIALAAADARVRVVAIENRGIDSEGAKYFAEQIQAHKADHALVLIGNAHARKLPIQGRDVAPFAQTLGKLGQTVTALDIEAGSGEFWGCTRPGECAPRPVVAKSRGDNAFVELRSCRDACPFDGVLFVPRVSVADPVPR